MATGNRLTEWAKRPKHTCSLYGHTPSPSKISWVPAPWTVNFFTIWEELTINNTFSLSHSTFESAEVKKMNLLIFNMALLPHPMA